jgi:lipopolysaccharide cholinephosphotransferase
LAAKIIPESVLDNKKLLLSIDNSCKKRDFDSSSWVGNLLGAWRFKGLIPRECFGEPKLYEFEGHMMYGPQLPEEYLTNIYGNWRKMPPIEKQVSHHDFIEFDLHKSYLNK